jgi:hypothetical protein
LSFVFDLDGCRLRGAGSFDELSGKIRDRAAPFRDVLASNFKHWARSRWWRSSPSACC